MKLVSQILDKKGKDIWFVSPNQTMFEALTLMAEKKVGALVVLENKKLVGIISERDYARKVILKGKTSKETLVEEIMTPDIICVSPNNHADECMAIMIEKRIRHLPVMEKDNLIGIVSIGDVVKAVIDEKEFLIDQLVHYIKGTHTIKE